MNPKAMEHFRRALFAYFEGDTTAELIIRKEESGIPFQMKVFCRG
jgi:hypothetical protein